MPKPVGVERSPSLKDERCNSESSLVSGHLVIVCNNIQLDLEMNM